MSVASAAAPISIQQNRRMNIFQNVGFHAKRGALIGAKSALMGVGLSTGVGIAVGIPTVIGAATSHNRLLGTAASALALPFSLSAGCALGYVAGMAGAALATPIGAIAGATRGIIESIVNRELKTPDNLEAFKKKDTEINENIQKFVRKLAPQVFLDKLKDDVRDVFQKIKAF